MEVVLIIKERNIKNIIAEININDVFFTALFTDKDTNKQVLEKLEALRVSAVNFCEKSMKVKVSRYPQENNFTKKERAAIKESFQSFLFPTVYAKAFNMNPYDIILVESRC